MVCTPLSNHPRSQDNPTAFFSAPRRWAAPQETLKHPLPWPSLRTQLIPRLRSQAPAGTGGWGSEGGLPAGPSPETHAAGTVHLFTGGPFPVGDAVQRCAGIHSQGPLLMEVRVEAGHSSRLEGNHPCEPLPLFSTFQSCP